MNYQHINSFFKDAEQRVQKEQVVPVAELKATISQMLKEALDEHKANQSETNEKGRATELSLGRLCRWDDRASRTGVSAHLKSLVEFCGRSRSRVGSRVR